MKPFNEKWLIARKAISIPEGNERFEEILRIIYYSGGAAMYNLAKLKPELNLFIESEMKEFQKECAMHRKVS